jgi:hypothetical protein
MGSRGSQGPGWLSTRMLTLSLALRVAHEPRASQVLHLAPAPPPAAGGVGAAGSVALIAVLNLTRPTSGL